MTTAPARPTQVPAVVAGRPVTLPVHAEKVLENGLRVVAVRRSGVPLVEVRLRVAAAVQPGKKLDEVVAATSLLGETLLTGTRTRDTSSIATDLQEVGGALNAGADTDKVSFSGSALASGLPRLLEVLADVLLNATYPRTEVAGERGRLVSDLVLARSQPSVLASEAVGRRCYPKHPYARELAQPDEVGSVKAKRLRALHEEILDPAGALLVIVGDVRPETALEMVETALGAWATHGRTAKVPTLPALVRGPLALLHRAGSVQTSVRLVGAAVPRHHVDYPALQMANAVFGGGFTSRLTSNIREDKGYTYSPHSTIDHHPAGSLISVAAEVSTEVTAPALLETRYELGRMATLPATQAELDAARRYAIGTLALGTSTQAGLASTLLTLLVAGEQVSFLREHPARLEAVTLDDVLAASATYLAPAALVTVMVGDAERVRGPLETLGEVELV